MFTLKKQVAVLAHINIRDEKHGEDNVLAMDLKITADMPNTFLNQVAPGLLPALYKAEDGQAPLLDDGHMPVLSFDGMDPVVFNTNIVDANFVIHGAKKADEEHAQTMALKGNEQVARAAGYEQPKPCIEVAGRTLLQLLPPLLQLLLLQKRLKQTT